MLNKKGFLLILLFWLSFLPLSILSFFRQSYFKENLENFSATSSVVVLTTLFLISIIYFLLTKHSEKFSFSLKTVYIVVLPLLILLYLTPPMLSIDIFAYMVVGKNLAMEEHNPYTVAMNHNPLNSWNSTIDNVWWASTPSPYGPVFNISLKFLCSLTNNLLIAIYAYKFFTVMGYLLILYLFNKVIEQKKLKALLLFLLATNPTFLIHVVLEGHNEVLVITLILLSIYSLNAKKPFLGILSNALAISIKYVSVIFVPIFFIRDGKISLKQAIATSLLSGAVLFGSLSYFGNPSLSLVSSNINFKADLSCLYVCSPFVRFSNLVFGEWSSPIRVVVFVALYIFLIYKFLFKSTDIIKFAFWSLFSLLFVYVSWLTPWYVCMLLPLALLLSDKSKFYRHLAFILTCYSFIHYFGFL